MNVKSGLICSLIIVLLTLCVPNVAIASTSKQAINVHSSYATDRLDKEQPIIALALSDNETTVNGTVGVYGGIATADDQGNLNWIGGVTITIQQLNWDGTQWYDVGTVQTLTGKDAGIFIASYTPHDQGYKVFRATYDGDSNYEPAVSNIVALVVS